MQEEQQVQEEVGQRPSSPLQSSPTGRETPLNYRITTTPQLNDLTN